ncbi:hypothetical protein THIOM_000172 [Candidatus Thiomargarita nelsonii]|uniref:Uncharacterized protein n=1 Tax=Candidatus Thiomargarita nelsonii TaxID=1003181 RepID=A0A176S7J0_9GAMM|nr:hypothetical protein THIOM_000172 [Candidatus Thiomargarita nelsonii]
MPVLNAMGYSDALFGCLISISSKISTTANHAKVRIIDIFCINTSCFQKRRLVDPAF